MDHPATPSAKLAEPLEVDEIHLWSLAYRSEQGRQPLRQILGRYLACAADAVQLVESSHGRPELASTPTLPLHFNWSHSGQRALVAVARTTQPGIDLEQHGRRPRHRVDAIARRFFAPGEIAFLAALAPERKEAAFLRLWTAKEALLKAHGQGLSYGLHRVAVDADAAQPRVHAFEGEDPSCWQLQALTVDDGHVAALAWRGRPMRLRWMPALD